MTPFDSIQTFRLRVIERARENGVSSACRESGVSRTVFHRWRKRFLANGPGGLRPRWSRTFLMVDSARPLEGFFINTLRERMLWWQVISGHSLR